MLHDRVAAEPEGVLDALGPRAGVEPHPVALPRALRHHDNGEGVVPLHDIEDAVEERERCEDVAHATMPPILRQRVDGRRAPASEERVEHVAPRVMGRGEAIDVEGGETLANQLERPPTQANIVGIA